jgi:hypothetical protein
MFYKRAAAILKFDKSGDLHHYADKMKKII